MSDIEPAEPPTVVEAPPPPDDVATTTPRRSPIALLAWLTAWPYAAAYSMLRPLTAMARAASVSLYDTHLARSTTGHHMRPPLAELEPADPNPEPLELTVTVGHDPYGRTWLDVRGLMVQAAKLKMVAENPSLERDVVRILAHALSLAEAGTTSEAQLIELDASVTRLKVNQSWLTSEPINSTERGNQSPDPDQQEEDQPMSETAVPDGTPPGEET